MGIPSWGLIELKRADIYGQSEYKRDEKLAEIGEIERLYRDTVADGECVVTADLAVCGKDIIEAGVQKGPEVGRMLKRLLALVIEDPSQNERDILMSKVDEWRQG